MRTTSITALLVFTLLNGALAGSLNVKNSCSFSVYCLATRGATAAKPKVETSSITEVAAGGTYATTGDFVATANSVGIALKCSTNSDVSSPYQLEVSISTSGTTWYDLSALDGNTFANYERAAGIPSDSACVKEECAAGSTSCEWPNQNSCSTQDAVYMYLCSYD